MQDEEVREWRRDRSEHQPAGEERRHEMPGKLRERTPVLVRDHSLQRLGDRIPGEILAEQAATRPALRRIQEEYCERVGDESAGESADLRTLKQKR